MGVRKYLIGILLISLACLANVQAQCPDDPRDLIINTQWKYDNIYLAYPDCDQFGIYMENGKFIGDPRPLPYLIALFAALAVVLAVLKFIIVKLKVE